MKIVGGPLGIAGRAEFWLLTAFALCLAALAQQWWAEPPFSPDSWSYYELSRSLRAGGYSLNTLRTFGDPTKNLPSTSFPPLWPLVWAGASAITGLGVRSGFVLTFALTLVFAALSELAGRRVFNARFIGIAAAALVCLTPGYFTEVIAARSIPLQLVLVASILVVASRPSASPARGAAFLGLLCGAAVLTRFDMLPFALTFGFALTLRVRSARVVGCFIAALLVALSPWIVASFMWHGVPFASDNSGVALSADPSAFVTDWRAPGSERPVIFDHPGDWLVKVVTNAGSLVVALLQSPGPWAGSLLALIAFVTAARASALPAACAKLFVGATGEARLTAVICLSAAALSMLPLYVLVGYFDDRYFSLTIWLATLFGLGLAGAAIAGSHDRIMISFATFLLALNFVVHIPAERGREANIFPELSVHEKLASCMARRAPNSNVRLLLTDDALAGRLSAVYGMKTALLPRNFTRKPQKGADVALFARTYCIGFIAGDSDMIEMIAPKSLREDAASDCGMPMYALNLPLVCKAAP